MSDTTKQNAKSFDSPVAGKSHEQLLREVGVNVDPKVAEAFRVKKTKPLDCSGGKNVRPRSR
jgi:hypothetical protein